MSDWAHFNVDEIAHYLIEALADEPVQTGGTTMDEVTQTAMIEMEARQNAALTAMWKLFRQGKFTGADGIDGKIVELDGGKPLDFEPTYPKV